MRCEGKTSARSPKQPARGARQSGGVIRRPHMVDCNLLPQGSIENKIKYEKNW